SLPGSGVRVRHCPPSPRPTGRGAGVRGSQLYSLLVRALSVEIQQSCLIYSFQLNSFSTFASSATLAFLLFPVPALLTAAESTGPVSRRARVFLLDGEHLRATQQRIHEGDKTLAPSLTQLERDAKSALHAGPFSVVEKTNVPPSGDKHDYMSIGPYFWPDPGS